MKRGYSRDVGSAAVFPPPHEGVRRLYHFTSADHGTSNIVFRRLKISRFATLNDPFELLARRASNFSHQKSFEDIKRNYASEHGLLCFSEDWTDPVLWAHYGANHRGVALGFDVEEGLARQVSYRSDRFSSTEGMSATQDELLQLLLYTKYESWRYEREWRVLLKLKDVASNGGMHFYGFDSRVKLAEIVLGSDCSLPLAALRELVAILHPNVGTVQGRLSLREFKIVPDEKTIIARPPVKVRDQA